MPDMPENMFLIRMAIEDARYHREWRDIVEKAASAFDAWDWPKFRTVAEEALFRDPCGAWQARIRDLLSDPVFQRVQ